MKCDWNEDVYVGSALVDMYARCGRKNGVSLERSDFLVFKEGRRRNSFKDDQERETNLQYHSKKIALAFALIQMPTGATIRIMKNIRICGDCHSAFKYVSKVFKREIVVRDTNRFHHFSNGSCSCGDYW
uniref:DYW domain-containing protein n=1 Tax=Aegilops tauschii TaxID=37682 RepID=M8BX76_AEGTA